MTGIIAYSFNKGTVGSTQKGFYKKDIHELSVNKVPVINEYIIVADFFLFLKKLKD